MTSSYLKIGVGLTAIALVGGVIGAWATRAAARNAAIAAAAVYESDFVRRNSTHAIVRPKTPYRFVWFRGLDADGKLKWCEYVRLPAGDRPNVEVRRPIFGMRCSLEHLNDYGIVFKCESNNESLEFQITDEFGPDDSTASDPGSRGRRLSISRRGSEAVLLVLSIEDDTDNDCGGGESPSNRGDNGN